MASFIGSSAGRYSQRTFFSSSQPPGPGNFSRRKPGLCLDSGQYQHGYRIWPGLSGSGVLDTTPADAAVILWGYPILAGFGLSSSPWCRRHCADAIFQTNGPSAFGLCRPADIHSYSGDCCLPASWFTRLGLSIGDVTNARCKCEPFFYPAVYCWRRHFFS